MNKPFAKVDLDNGVCVQFYFQENRYFGDYHRLQIHVIASIPLDVTSLPDDLKKAAAKYSGSISYEKAFERMGVATNRVDSTAESMVDDFIKTVGCYLEKKDFAENLLRKSLISQPIQNRFSV